MKTPRGPASGQTSPDDTWASDLQPLGLGGSAFLLLRPLGWWCLSRRPELAFGEEGGLGGTGEQSHHF